MLDDIYQVSFEGNRIDLVPGVDLYNHDFTTLPNRDIKIYKLARRSLSIITSSEYTDKTIRVWADVCSGTRQDTEATLADVKALLQAQNGSLNVLQANLEVRYTATMNEFNVEWNASNAYVEIVFIASDPIGTATSSTTLFSLSAVTTSSASATFNVDGSYLAEPLINLVFNSVTGGTGGSVNLFNGRTGQGITITGNFATGSILSIDSLNYTATLNGQNIDFEGLFPSFPAGTQQFGYSDTFTTRNVDILGQYNQRLV